MAVHGIGAHPDDTWCKKVDAGRPEERYVNWLRDGHMLPAVVPNTRIMRYGYQSQWYGDEAISQKASTVAQRLLLTLKRARKVRSSSPVLGSGHAHNDIDVSPPSFDIHRALLWWTGGPQSRLSGGR